MIAHDPSLVILAITIAILGIFTASVMTSNIGALSLSEGRMRAVMAAATLGGSIWAMQFVGLLSIELPVNFGHDPLLLGLSAIPAFSGTAAALFLLWPKRGDYGVRLRAGAAVLGLSIAATHYIGLAAVAADGLRLGWFLTLITIAVSIEAALCVLWFLFQPRGVVMTLAGAAALGPFLTATHYAAAASAQGLDRALLAIPQNPGGISERYLAWSAAIMMYLICSICLSVFVITQFREDIE